MVAPGLQRLLKRLPGVLAAAFVILFAWRFGNAISRF